MIAESFRCVRLSRNHRSSSSSTPFTERIQTAGAPQPAIQIIPTPRPLLGSIRRRRRGGCSSGLLLTLRRNVREPPRIADSGGTVDLKPQHHRRFVLHHVPQDAGARVSGESAGTLLPIAPQSSMRRDKTIHVVEDCHPW